MILDLRENPGGLLDAAVEVVDKFVPRGSLVVSTRGRKPESERKYFAQEEPLLPDEPLVVLVNRNSASASEIVAGAIQDMDRGVVLGTRTFGKGLVQTVAPLVYNTELKITTAKYYTPSGRSIQEIDYMHKGGDGVFKVTPDSLRREFRTARGRKVFELGGIAPDSVLELPEASTLHQELMHKSMYFKFATNYAAQHREGRPNSESDTGMFAEFKRFLEEKLFTYQEKGEVKLKELREIADKSKYSTAMMMEIERLSEQMKEEKEKAYERNKAEILRVLKAEIAARYEGEKGRIRTLLPDDMQVQAAVGLVKTSKSYEKILAGK
jgi:carboxyl-terminal processing protease